MNPLNRRSFLARSKSAAVGLAFAGSLGQLKGVSGKPAASTPSRNRVGVFTKSFQDRSIADLCRIFKGMGLDGLDLTVRGAGMIHPKDVEAELPKAVQTAREAGVSILFLTTDITDPTPEAERVLATAAQQGIKRIKMGYYNYDVKKFGTLKRQIAEVRDRVEKVSRLARKHNLQPCIHIHSDAMIPSHGTLLYELIHDFSPDEVGAYVDTLHMVKEGGGEGWRQGLDLLGPWLALCSVKNFIWVKGNRDKHGQQQWRSANVPVAEGISPIPEFIAALKALNFKGDYSLHAEYKGKASLQDLDTDGCIRQTAEDFAFFRKLL